jgi:hypothetical protein
MDWNEANQKRFDTLRQLELSGTLTPSEQAELDSLTNWLTETADSDLAVGIHRLEEEQIALREQLQRRYSENEELAKLLHQQEQLMVESRRWLADFDARHRQISQTYTRLTGDILTPA